MMSRNENERLVDQLRFAESMLCEQDGLLAFDTSYRFIYWSERMRDLTGLGPEEVLGRDAFEVFPFLRDTGEDSTFREVLAGHRVASKDRPYTVPEARREGFYEASYTPVHTSEGTIVAGVAVVREVTDARRIEQRLRETESRFKNMADAAPVLLWMSGTDGLCNFFNATWIDFTGRTLEQEQGVGWAEGVHFEDLQRCMDTYISAFNERRFFAMEYRLRRADGEFRWILDCGTPRYTPEGEFAGFIGSCVDITEHKQLEAELRKAVRDRDDFLSIAAHELRTPLTALQLAVEKTTRALKGHDAGSIDLARLQRSAEQAAIGVKRLNSLVEDLLDVSRLSVGHPALVRETLDMSELARDVTARFADAARAAKTAFDVSAPNPVVGSWDRGQMDRVFVNLLSNALKYGSGSPVHVAVSAIGSDALIVVRDEGIGISPEDQSRIFERFERAVPAKNYGGFGLGLWITRRLVEAHGGRISVSSAAGRGAEFTIQVPMIQTAGPEA